MDVSTPLAPPIPPLAVKDRELKISVVSPTYNHARFLRQNLDATLGQTHPPFEVIVVNDASTDETHEILTEYAAKDSRVKYHRFERNQGSAVAVQHGCRMVSGDLIYCSASDDYLAVPHFFEQAVNFMLQIPQAAGVFGQAELISAETGKSICLMGQMGGHYGYIPPRSCMEFFLKHRGLMPGVTSILRWDLVKRLGGYPVELGPQGDYFVDHALAGLAGIVFLPKRVAFHRISETSYNANLSFQRRIRNYCLAEKKMRALRLFDGFDAETILSWRDALVENMMMAPNQRELCRVLKHLMSCHNEIFWMHLPEAPRRFFKSISVECEKLEKELVELKTWAMDEFKRTVGC